MSGEINAIQQSPWSTFKLVWRDGDDVSVRKTGRKKKVLEVDHLTAADS